MKHALVLVPLQCPHCNEIKEVAYEATEIARALSSTTDFRLYTTCHNASWKATDADRRSLTLLMESFDERRVMSVERVEVDEVSDSTNHACGSKSAPSD